MDVTSAGRVDSVYAVKVEKMAQDAAKVEGEGAVALIEGAKPPPVGPEGQGTHVNTYA